VTGGPDPIAPRDGGPGFWIGVAAGVPLIAVGVVGLLSDRAATHPIEAGRYFVGGALAHDLVLAPVVLAVGVAIRRVARPSVRRWLQAGLTVSAPVVLFSWPFVLGYGRLANNPSVLPRNYGRGAIVTFGAVWLIVIILGLVAPSRRPTWRGQRRRGELGGRGTVN
jgi:hypothetical protein